MFGFLFGLAVFQSGFKKELQIDQQVMLGSCKSHGQFIYRELVKRHIPGNLEISAFGWTFYVRPDQFSYAKQVAIAEAKKRGFAFYP